MTVEDILNHFYIDFTGYVTLRMACPVHQGRNRQGAAIYGGQDMPRWQCFTRGCHETFGNSILGLVWGILSQQQGWEPADSPPIPLDVARRYLDCLGPVVGRENERQAVAPPRISRDEIRNRLKIPCQYFVDRGFSPYILDRFDVGLCTDWKKLMAYRCVAPIYNMNGEYVGATARSTNPQCQNCKLYHWYRFSCEKARKCQWRNSKWMNSPNFPKSSYLYNLHNVRADTVIVVESPGNVWKIVEAGYNNVVATLGCSMSKTQRTLLSRFSRIILAYDNDDEGRYGASFAAKRLYGRTEIFNRYADFNDFGEMPTELVERVLRDYRN